MGKLETNEDDEFEGLLDEDEEIEEEPEEEEEIDLAEEVADSDEPRVVKGKTAEKVKAIQKQQLKAEKASIVEKPRVSALKKPVEAEHRAEAKHVPSISNTFAAAVQKSNSIIYYPDTNEVHYQNAEMPDYIAAMWADLKNDIEKVSKRLGNI